LNRGDLTSETVTGRDPSSGKPFRVAFEAGHIARIDHDLEFKQGSGGTAFGEEQHAVHDVEGLPWLSAGFVDLQINGYGGVDFNDDTIDAESLEALADRLLELGVTTFLPTLITASEEALVSRLSAIAAVRRSSARLQHMIPFVHVEGPFISPEDGPRGAHPEPHVRAPDLDEVDRWQTASGGLVGMVTLSPHWENASTFISALVDRDIHVAIGHTHAEHEAIVAAVDAGAVLSTHLGNGAAAVLPRHPNFLWSQLGEDRLTATFIADGHHLPAATLQSMARAKGPSRRVLVSDTVALGGLAPGRHEQSVGGSVELAANGRLSLAGTPYLAGAALPLHVGIANTVNQTSLSLGDAVAMATLNAGRFAGGRGLVAPGASADLVLFMHEPGCVGLDIRECWLAGERVYAA